MPTQDRPQSAVKHWQDCTDVYDFLEQIRLRPGMWLPGGSLQHLQSILIGYRVALGVHSFDETFAFWPGEAFTQWLREHHGISSSLGWAAEIERQTPADSTPVDEFFQLLDTFRRGAAPEPAWALDRSESGAPAQASWTAICQALPLGTPVTGEVVGRQRFGVFLTIDGFPDAVGLAEIVSMPREAVLPKMGELVRGEVIAHADHNCQVRIKLDGCKPGV